MNCFFKKKYEIDILLLNSMCEDEESVVLNEAEISDQIWSSRLLLCLVFMLSQTFVILQYRMLARFTVCVHYFILIWST